ncbi:MAG: hypothetical protein MZU95_15735 [Desulfomicrobium escambiense]|nr:hypothetical protein [Desulfomicrobium escambiense]
MGVINFVELPCETRIFGKTSKIEMSPWRTMTQMLAGLRRARGSSTSPKAQWLLEEHLPAWGPWRRSRR